MSLLVHLPLNKSGDLENKGLANITVTNNGATYSTGGKIGGCYYATSNINTGLTSDQWDYSTTSVSFGGWFKFNLAEINASAITSHTYTSSQSYSTGTLLGYNSYGGLSLYYTTNDVKTAGEVTYINVGAAYRDSSATAYTSTYRITFDTWTHFLVTFDIVNHKLALYVNGTLHGSIMTLPTTTVSKTYNFFINIATVYGGNGPAYSIPCRINDIRVYNHVLSTAERLQISLGLILHYPLSDTSVLQRVNLGNTSTSYSTRTHGEEITASGWGGDAGTCTFYHYGGYRNMPYKVYHKTATGTGGIYLTSNTRDIIICAGVTYTMSVWVKSNISFTDSAYSFNINGIAGSDTNHYITYGSSVPFTTEWTRLSRTFTATESDAGTYLEMSIIYDDNVTDYYVYYCGFQIEEGTVATEWIPTNCVYTKNLVSLTTVTGHGSSWTKQSGTYFGDDVYLNTVTSSGVSNNAGFCILLFNYSTSCKTFTFTFNRYLTTSYIRSGSTDSLGGYLRATLADGTTETQFWSYNLSPGNPGDAHLNKWEQIRATVTFSTTLNITGLLGSCYMDKATQGSMKVSRIQIQEGDKYTIYTPSEIDTRNTTIYDTSGLNNNGTITGSLTVSSDSPRYSNSTYFNGSTTINCSNPFSGQTTELEWTISCWIKPISFTTSTRLNNFNNYNYLSYGNAYLPLLYLNSGDNDYYTYALALSTGSWMHIIYVFKNSTGRREVWKNGVNISTSGPNKTNTPSGMLSTITWLSSYTGYVSDLRLYATALSASDISDLYKMGGLITNNGTLLAYELLE